MSQTAPLTMTTEYFLDWQARQADRYELVDGRPVAMTGARFEHDLVVEFQTIASLRTILLISPTEPEVAVWARDESGAWQMTRLTGNGSTIPVPALAIDLPLAEIYDDIIFPPTPRLVWPYDPA